MGGNRIMTNLAEIRRQFKNGYTFHADTVGKLLTMVEELEIRRP